MIRFTLVEDHDGARFGVSRSQSTQIKASSTRSPIRALCRMGDSISYGLLLPRDSQSHALPSGAEAATFVGLPARGSRSLFVYGKGQGSQATGTRCRALEEGNGIPYGETISTTPTWYAD